MAVISAWGKRNLLSSQYLKQVNSKAVDVGSKSPLSTTVVTPESIKIWKQNKSLAMSWTLGLRVSNTILRPKNWSKKRTLDWVITRELNRVPSTE